MATLHKEATKGKPDMMSGLDPLQAGSFGIATINNNSSRRLDEEITARSGANAAQCVVNEGTK